MKIKDLSPDELIGIMDELLACLVRTIVCKLIIKQFIKIELTNYSTHSISNQ